MAASGSHWCRTRLGSVDYHDDGIIVVVQENNGCRWFCRALVTSQHGPKTVDGKGNHARNTGRLGRLNGLIELGTDTPGQGT